MKTMICKKCLVRMEEIEFEYVHFDKQYKTTCKDCDGYLRPLSQTILWEKRESEERVN